MNRLNSESQLLSALGVCQRDKNDENLIMYQALSALGVNRGWYRVDRNIVEEARKRAKEIARYERVYNVIGTLSSQTEVLETALCNLKNAIAPMKDVQENSDNNDNSTAKILDF